MSALALDGAGASERYVDAPALGARMVASRRRMPVQPDPHIPALLALTFALLVVAASLAALVASRREDHRPFALFLTAIVLVSAVRWVLMTWWLVPYRASYPEAPLAGPALVAAHIDTALWLVWPAGLAAVSIAVYLRRKPWLVGVVWLLVSLAIAYAYPATRGDVLRRCYLAAELAALCVAAGSIGMWTRLHQSVTLPRACVLLLVIFDFATVVMGPWVGDPFHDWHKAQILYSMLYGSLILMQGGALWTRPSSRSD